MPRKKTTLGKSAEPIAETSNTTTQEQGSGKKWAEAYRPLVTNPDAGFEMGENKITRQMVFYFAGDPGSQVKERLKHYGYIYHTDQKAWTVNATPVTREIAKDLASEFAGGKGRGR
jgi:hypothetical protein